MIDFKSKYYISKDHGGYNPCILGNNKYSLRPSAGSVLPDCTGFVVGYFNESQKLGGCKWLGPQYPKDYIPTAKKQGLKTGDEIKVGAVAVWEKHVAIIKDVTPEGVEVIESSWNYKKNPIVRVVKYTSKSRVEKAYSDFKGYIYQPSGEKTEEPGPMMYTVKAGDTLTKIAKKYNTTINQILRDNPIIKNRNLIKVGWKLKIRKGA